MTTQEEKILYWIHYHEGSASKSQIQRHLANVKVKDRDVSLKSLKDRGHIESKMVHKHFGRPTEVISLTDQGAWYIKKMKEEGRIE